MLALALLVPPIVDYSSPPGPVLAGYAPMGRYAGHWGVDFGAPPGSLVRAVLPGTVTFSGFVVENLSVTVHYRGGMRTSYSFLSRLAVSQGEVLNRGDLVGESGLAHGIASWHLSLRLGYIYADPMQLFGCHSSPGSALWLVSFTSRSSLYAVGRAERHTRRNFRPTSRGAPHGWGGCNKPARSRRCDLCHRRGPISKGGGAAFIPGASVEAHRAGCFGH